MVSFALTSYADWLKPELIYIALSVVVAILIWCEGQMLKKSDGKLPKSKFFQLSSFFDTFWFFISLVALYFLDFTPLALAVPAAYGIYTVFGWIYGTKLLKRQGLPDSPKELVIPVKYIAYSQSFALIFFGLCLFVLLGSIFPALNLTA